MPAMARPGSPERTGEQSLSPRMMPSIRYRSAFENDGWVGRGVGFGIGRTVGAGVTTGGAAVGSEGDVDGSIGADGSGEPDGAETGGGGTTAWLGTGVDAPHAARTNAAMSETARTSLGIGFISEVCGSCVALRCCPFDACRARLVGDNCRYLRRPNVRFWRPLVPVKYGRGSARWGRTALAARAVRGRTLTRVDERTAANLLTSAEEVSAGIRGPEAKAAVERLETDYDQLLAALRWFLDQGRTDEALRLANALYRFWITQQRFEDGAFWFDRALGAPGGDDHLRGAAFINAGFMPFWLGHDERAAELFSEGLRIGRQLDDASLVSQALGGLARVALRTDVADGRRLAREALDVSDAANDVAGRSNALHLLGVGAQIAGDLPEARDWMTQRLALVRDQGNQFLVASEASNLSMVERQLGNLDAAESLARESLSTSTAIGDRFTVPFAFSGLASIAAERAAYERAATLVGAAEALMEAQHMAWPPDELPHYERLLATLRESMGDAAFEWARAGGRSMADADAISFALDDAEGSTAT